ncbi:MAG TPA: LLM class flavin-dependent oxidoreductase [Candidatus Dormibacteraeota bacterium]
MKVGVGLPTSTPGHDEGLLKAWAQRADELGFSSLGVVDRVGYDCVEPLSALTLAAGVTQRARLVTTILIGPLRPTEELAAQATALHRTSGGRLVLGLGIGARHDDYQAKGVDPSRRGRVLAEQLAALRIDASSPPMLVGGGGPAFLRAARFADGYVHGGGPPRAFATAAARARAAWCDAGRPGRPQLWGQGYFALGDAARGADYLRDYYAFTGAFAGKIAAANLTSPQAVKAFVRGYEDEGCDELVLFPTVSGLDQLERLAEAVAP